MHKNTGDFSLGVMPRNNSSLFVTCARGSSASPPYMKAAGEHPFGQSHLPTQLCENSLFPLISASFQSTKSLRYVQYIIGCHLRGKYAEFIQKLQDFVFPIWAVSEILLGKKLHQAISTLLKLLPFDQIKRLPGILGRKSSGEKLDPCSRCTKWRRENRKEKKIDDGNFFQEAIRSSRAKNPICIRKGASNNK